MPDQTRNDERLDIITALEEGIIALECSPVEPDLTVDISHEQAALRLQRLASEPPALYSVPRHPGYRRADDGDAICLAARVLWARSHAGTEAYRFQKAAFQLQDLLVNPRVLGR